jgi:hypothetical protein
MLKKEFEMRTGLQVTEKEFTQIHNDYMASDLDKDAWCKQYMQQTEDKKQAKQAVKDEAKQYEFDKDWFVPAAKMETAIKALFRKAGVDCIEGLSVEDMIEDWRDGAQKWLEAYEEIKDSKDGWHKATDQELREKATKLTETRWRDYECRITPYEYYIYQRMEDDKCTNGFGFGRVCVELRDDNEAYISAGWRWSRD